MSETKNGGIVTAYGAAKRGGYTGTYSQFCEAMADLGIQVAHLEGMTVEVTMQSAGTAPSASYNSTNGTLTLNLPKGDKGDKGDTGYPTDEQVSSAVGTWLGENVDPTTGYVLDRTLTQENAAAPADLVGDLKESINSICDIVLVESESPNVDSTVSPVSNWVELSPYLESGKHYLIHVMLNNFSANQISKINSIGLYRNKSASALVQTLDFGSLVSNEWLHTEYVVPDNVTIADIKLSVRSSYVADSETISYKIVELLPLDEQLDETKSIVANNENRIETLELSVPRVYEKTLHLSYYPVTTRYITTNNLWSNNANCQPKIIPIDGAINIKVKANNENNASVALLKSFAKNVPVNTVPDYASGNTEQITIPSGNEIIIKVPSDACYLYVADLISTTLLPDAITMYVPENYVSLKKPLFVFMDDDGHKNALAWLEQVVNATRIPITIALITGVVQEEQDSEKYTTWTNLRRLKNKGFVFVNHTNTTVSLNTLTQDEVEASFIESQRLMEEHGMPDSDILVYPGGNVSSDNINIVKNYFRFGVSTQQNINVPPIKTWFLNRLDLDTTAEDRLVTWKTQVDKTIEINGLCIFYSHAYRDDYDSTKLTEYISLVNYIAQKGGRIVSLPEALREYRNNITTDNATVSDTTGFVGCDEIIV